SDLGVSIVEYQVIFVCFKTIGLHAQKGHIPTIWTKPWAGIVPHHSFSKINGFLGIDIVLIYIGISLKGVVLTRKHFGYIQNGIPFRSPCKIFCTSKRCLRTVKWLSFQEVYSLTYFSILIGC